MNKKSIVLVIIAHPDDEVIGCGGTIAKHIKNGDSVFAISMTDGVGSRSLNLTSIEKKRQEAAINASKILKMNWVDRLHFPDNQLDTVPLLEIVKAIERVKQQIRPNIIYTHNYSDLNIDHRIVCQSTLTAFRPQTNEIWDEIRAFEVASATDYGHKSLAGGFMPNLFIDITDTWALKLAALYEYREEIRENPHSRSFIGIENLAKYRGNQVGLHYAEAFEILRKIER